MKDEIKEILQLIGNCCYYGKINEEKCEKYCSYITNLQEENQHLQEVLDYEEDFNRYLKSRNEKAVELIDEYMKYPPHYITGYVGKKIRNILQGEDKDE